MHARLYDPVSSSAPLHGPQTPRYVISIVAVIVLGPVADILGGMAGQIAVGVVSWGVMLHLLSLQTFTWRITLILGCAIALAAEMFFSLGLHWYDYQFGNIPPFVPPGHILLFMLGQPLARQLPNAFFRFAPWLVAVYGVYASVSGTSTLDATLACIILLVWQRQNSRPIYAAMLIISLALELWGTWLGNWTWQAQVPYTGGLVTGNPPLLAGALYGLFDMLLMRMARRIHRRLGDMSAAAPQLQGNETALPDTIQVSKHLQTAPR